MQHRNLLCTTVNSEMDENQVWNHLHSERHLQLDRMASNGVNPALYSNLTPRSNDYPSSSLSLDVPQNAVLTSGTSHGAYLYPSPSGSSSRIASNYAHYGPSSYNLHGMHGEQDRTLNSQMEHGRHTFKRKYPATTMAYNGTSSSRYHSSGSFSTPHSSEHFRQKPWAGSPNLPWDPNSMVPNYRGNNLLVHGEVSQRNVRIRQTDALHIEGNNAGSQFSCNMPFHLHSTADSTGPVIGRQWTQSPGSLVSHGWLSSSDTGSSNDMNQSFPGSCISSGSWERDGQLHPNIIPSRNPSAPMPVLCGPPPESLNGGISFGQTTASRYMPSYPSLGPVPTSLENGGRVAPEGFSRHSRPLCISGAQNYDRSGRSRNLNVRFQSHPDENNVRARFITESAVMMDQSTFYGSRNLYDQHHDMRLDIDTMSYEELLALEERIGDVNTGLSEDMISKCLTGTICSSSDQTRGDDGRCVICLEGYKDREELGLLKCGHEFHVCCITQWLRVKNLCPICKATALEDASNEK